MSPMSLLLVTLFCTCMVSNVESEGRNKRFWNPIGAVLDVASKGIDSVGLGAVNPIKIGGQLIGGAIGGAGLVFGKQENKKCYYHWGLGFSGPESWNPSRWNGAHWDAEDKGGLLHGISDAVGFGWTVFLHVFETEEARIQTCKMLGLGYSTQQPGFPSKPGTCPQGPDCSGTPGVSIKPQPGQALVGYPSGSIMVYTIPGQEGQVSQGTLGAVMTILIPGQQPFYIPDFGDFSDSQITITGNSNGGQEHSTSNIHITGNYPGGQEHSTSDIHITGNYPGGQEHSTSTTHITGNYPGGQDHSTSNIHITGNYPGGQDHSTSNIHITGNYPGGQEHSTSNIHFTGNYPGGQEHSTSTTHITGNYPGGQEHSTSNIHITGNYPGGQDQGTSNIHITGNYPGGQDQGTSNVHITGNYPGGQDQGTSNVHITGNYIPGQQVTVTTTTTSTGQTRFVDNRGVSYCPCQG